MIKIAVIGAYGFMGKNHARNLKALQDSDFGVELKAVSDVNPKVSEVAELYEASSYEDYREMFAQEELDAVVIAVPTVHHCQVTCDALEAGLHVMVEKPIAFTVGEADEMVSLAKRRNLKLMVGHIEWFNPVVRKLVSMIAGGELGEILMIETKRMNPFPKGRDDAVGISIDLATHDIFNVLKIFELLDNPFYGRPLAAGGSSPLTTTQFEDHVTMLLAVDGVVAEVTASWLHPFKVRSTTIVGTKGTAMADLISRELVVYPVGGGYNVRDMNAALYDLTFTERRVPEVPDRRTEPMRLELMEFVNVVKENRTPEVTGEAALDTLRIALEASKQVLGGVRR